MKPIAVLIALVVFSTTATASDVTQCNIDKFSSYSKAKEAFQRSITDLAINAVPEAKDTAIAYLNDQIMLINRQKLAVELLLTHNPAKVQVSERLRRWLALRPKDDKALSKLSPKYAALMERIAKSREVQNLPNADKLHEAMRTKIAPSPQFRKLYEALNKKNRQLNRIHCK